jgi:hypothetical protein
VRLCNCPVCKNPITNSEYWIHIRLHRGHENDAPAPRKTFDAQNRGRKYPLPLEVNNPENPYLLTFEDTAECARVRACVCVHLRYAKKLYILQSLFTLILHLALLWRQLPFMKYSRCEAPSRSVTVLSCSFFGAPEPVRGCTAFLKPKAMQNSSRAPAQLPLHTCYSISLLLTSHFLLSRLFPL